MAKVYDFIELVGTSSKGWEDAIQNVVAVASQELTNMRVAEVAQMDTMIKSGKVVEYRVKVRLSFKHEVEPETL